MTTQIRRIAVNTGGGDAPGLNAVIESVVHAARGYGWEVFGIRDGYDGLLEPQRYNNDGVLKLDRRSINRISGRGGTILGTTNRGNPFSVPRKNASGEMEYHDRSDEVVEGLKRMAIDALVVVGGDGSLSIARDLVKKGVRVVGVPKTIDNDLSATTLTFGFDTAVSFATECLDRLRTTAESHHRIMVVEVMGRNAGWIALHCGIAGRADIILIPEIPYDANHVAAQIKSITSGSDRYVILVVAEGAFPIGGELSIKGQRIGGKEILGGIGEKLAQQLQNLTGRESRAVVLGHLLRGGAPTALDRLLGLSFGASAVNALAVGMNNVMVALKGSGIVTVPIEAAVKSLKTVPPDSELVKVARSLGISFGDSPPGKE